MEALRALTGPSIHMLNKTKFTKPIFIRRSNRTPNSPFSTLHKNPPSKSKLFITSVSSSSSTSVPKPDAKTETETETQKFDWYDNWYPVMPVCDLDKRIPHGTRVMGLDIVVWWDRNQNEWRVFDDTCPHRLAPLSEGRIDQWGRLQCVYHGWCFGGSGDCKFIPQAPPNGPPVHTFKQACARVYPSTTQNDIVWFWPSTDPKYESIIDTKKPPYIPELDDPSFFKFLLQREFPYGYEVLVENLIDPAHLPYAHFGLPGIPKPKVIKADREGGRPLEITVEKIDADGFTAKQETGSAKFMAPCVCRVSPDTAVEQETGSLTSAGSEKASSAERIFFLLFICIPVSPGKSRLIWSFPRNFRPLVENLVPQWMFHIQMNLMVDSDLHLLHVEERRILERGPENWQKACFVPTKSDALVVAFRRWFNKYGGGQVDWRGKFNAALLPPTPPLEQLMDRYWSHVVSCRICSVAYKRLNALEVVLQVFSVISIGILAGAKQNGMPEAMRAAVAAMAVACFVASRWLAHFIYKNYHFHDYNHALL